MTKEKWYGVAGIAAVFLAAAAVLSVNKGGSEPVHAEVQTVARGKKAAGPGGGLAEELNAELAESGIDGKELLHEITEHPSRIRVQVPEHTRKRFIVFTPEHEKIIAERFLRDMESEGKLYTDAAEEARVRKIAERIAAVLPEKIPVNIRLVKDDTVNAFCLIDGSVFVHSGLLKAFQDEDMLAAMIAHEYGHAAARHGAEGLTKALMRSAGGIVVKYIQQRYNAQGKKIRGYLLGICYGLGSHYGFILPYSRTMEYEADKLGMIFMKKAGYGPEAMIRAFEYLEQADPTDSPFLNYLSTHPVNAKRIRRARKVLQKLNSAG